MKTLKKLILMNCQKSRDEMWIEHLFDDDNNFEVKSFEHEKKIVNYIDWTLFRWNSRV